MITNKSIEADIRFYKRYKVFLGKKLRNLPKGNIYYKENNGHKRPYVRRNGKECYLNQKKMKEIIGLRNRKEIERALRLIDDNIRVLDSIEGDIADFDAIVPQLADQKETEGMNRSQKAEFISNRFASEENRANSRKRNMTSDGIGVRSRAELILYEHFKSLGLEFYYEKPLMIDGIVFHPDFTIVRKSDRKIILWEHNGMMDRPDYVATFQRRQFQYAGAGYLPFVNLIYSYDFGEDTIDLLYVDRLLEMMGLI